MNTNWPKNDTPKLYPFRLEEAKLNKGNVVTWDGKPAEYIGLTSTGGFPHGFRIVGSGNYAFNDNGRWNGIGVWTDLFMTTPAPLPAQAPEEQRCGCVGHTHICGKGKLPAPEEPSLEAQTILRLKRERDDAVDKLDSIREVLPDDSPSHRADITGQTMAEDVADLVKANDKFQKVCADYHTRLSDQIAYAVALQRIVESLHAGAPIVGDKCPHHAKLAEKIRSLYEATKSRAESAEAQLEALQRQYQCVYCQTTEALCTTLEGELREKVNLLAFTGVREIGYKKEIDDLKKQLAAPAWIPVSTPPTRADANEEYQVLGVSMKAKHPWRTLSNIHYKNVVPGSGVTHWMKITLPPSTPTEEETERINLLRQLQQANTGEFGEPQDTRIAGLIEDLIKMETKEAAWKGAQS